MSAARRRPDPGTEARMLRVAVREQTLPRLLILAPPGRGEDDSWFAMSVLAEARAYAREQEADLLDVDGLDPAFEMPAVADFLRSPSLFDSGPRALVFGRAGRALGKFQDLSDLLVEASASASGPAWALVQLDGSTGAKLATVFEKLAKKQPSIQVFRFRALWGDPPPWNPQDEDASEAAKFVLTEARDRGLQLRRGASGALVRLVGGRAKDLIQAVEHFLLLGHSKVDAALVADVVSRSAEGSAQTFAAALLDGDGAAAFRILGRIRRRGLRTFDGRRLGADESYSLLVSSVASARRRTVEARNATGGARGPAAQRMETRLQRTDARHDSLVLRALRDAERGVKVEGTLGPFAALEQMALRCYRRRRSG